MQYRERLLNSIELSRFSSRSMPNSEICMCLIHYVSMLRTNAHLFEFNSHSKHGNNKDHHLVRIQQCDLRKRIGSDSTVFLLCFDYYASDHKQLSQLTVKFG